MSETHEATVIVPKPVVSYWKSGDPCYKLNELKNKLTEINVINTKQLTDEFVEFCIQRKDIIYLHVNITGMGQTPFEPNIPSVKKTFLQIKKLIENGFPQKQILVCVNPIIPNHNGLKALQLLLKVFTEFRPLRLRFVRFNVLGYRQNENGKYVISNNNINSRQGVKPMLSFLMRVGDFYKEYNKLISDYSAIITVDKGEESLIGVRELLAFGLRNEWINYDGTKEKIINYERGNKHKPDVTLISDKKPIRCKNKCLLCPYLY